MKWTFIINQKLKVAFLLGSIMLLIALTNMLEQQNIKDINKSFSSIYYDRLIPATDIFYLTEQLYSKRLLMENVLYRANAISQDEIKKQLNNHNTVIDKLIDKFSKTYLVENESESLLDFKDRVEHYNKVEERILSILFKESTVAARKLYETEGKKDLLQTIEHLKALTKIQSAVGLELIHNSRSIISNSNVLMTLQITVAIIIGLAIQALVMASKLVSKETGNFNLN
jgi:hypothetical protein